jgi:hypothetical protein
MKITKFKQLIALTVLAVLAVIPIARGDAGIEDFGVTNRLDGTVSIVLPPTNGIGTNTGHFISVVNEAELGIEVRGTFVSTNTSDVLKITLVRASVRGAPSATDFEEDTGSSSWTFAVPYITTGTTSAAVTNALIWHTNLPTLWMRSATHLGVGAITNSALPLTSSPFTVGASQATGVTVSAVKKHIPAGSL